MRYLKIDSLPNSKHWVDRDTIMLHACFQLLKDCVEEEHADTHSNYEAYKSSIDEVRFLYKWWLKRGHNGETVPDYKEDTQMLDRLMKIRTFLWT